MNTKIEGSAQDCSGSSSQEKVKTTTNILFDECAQRSFITEELANKLKKKYTGLGTISVASFGGKTEYCRYIPTGKVLLHVEHRSTYRTNYCSTFA